VGKAADGSWKWWMCGALLLATMLNYMDRQTLSLTATQLKSEINLDDGRYGHLEEWFSYAFAAGGIFFGFLADRIGPRLLYPLVLTGWSLAGVVSPLASWPAIAGIFGDWEDPGSGEFRWLFMCRTVLGFCEAGHWPCALLTARNILTAKQRPLGNSILQSGASLGAILTPLVIQGIRATGLPWQGPFFIIGLIGLAWVPLWFTLLRAGDLKSQPIEDREADRERLDLWRFLYQVITLGTIVVTISLAWQFQRAWLPKYLKEYHHYSESAANYFTSGYYIVADIGCIFFGAVVSVLTARGMSIQYARLASFTGCTALVACSVLVPALERGPLLLLTLVLVGAGSLGAHPQYYALVQELPARHMGMLSGLLSAASWVVVGRMQGAIGEHIKRTGSYDVPLIATGVAPLAALALLVVWARINQKGNKPIPAETEKE
jgi:ACS family hexuronate transporter-like MFS transporter